MLSKIKEILENANPKRKFEFDAFKLALNSADIENFISTQLSNHVTLDAFINMLRYFNVGEEAKVILDINIPSKDELSLMLSFIVEFSLKVWQCSLVQRKNDALSYPDEMKTCRIEVFDNHGLKYRIFENDFGIPNFNRVISKIFGDKMVENNTCRAPNFNRFISEYFKNIKIPTTKNLDFWYFSVIMTNMTVLKSGIPLHQEKIESNVFTLSIYLHLNNLLAAIAEIFPDEFKNSLEEINRFIKKIETLYERNPTIQDYSDQSGILPRNESYDLNKKIYEILRSIFSYDKWNDKKILSKFHSVLISKCKLTKKFANYFKFYYSIMEVIEQLQVSKSDIKNAPGSSNNISNITFNLYDINKETLELVKTGSVPLVHLTEKQTIDLILKYKNKYATFSSIFKSYHMRKLNFIKRIVRHNYIEFLLQPSSLPIPIKKDIPHKSKKQKN